MLNQIDYIIGSSLVNIRLDKAAVVLDKTITRTKVKLLIENGDILVNQKKEKASYKLKLNDKVTINSKKLKEVKILPQEIPLDIIYEDDSIIVINKQKGLVVHPGNGNPDKTLANAVMHYLGLNLSKKAGELRPGIIHRIDKDTSRINNSCKNR